MSDALNQYLSALNGALTAFSNHRFLTRARLPGQGQSFALSLPGRNALTLTDGTRRPRADLAIYVRCDAVQSGGHQWAIRTRSYLYRLDDPFDPERQLVAYHWHPDVPGVEFPHIHPLVAGGEARRLHLVTPHVTLRHPLTFAVRDLGVTPRREDWRRALNAADAVMRSTLPPEGEW